MLIKSTSLLLFPGMLFAATITNKIEGIGPGTALKPFICVQNKSGQVKLSLAPGQSGDANAASGNAVYAGATLRFGGCEYNNTYLGYANMFVSSGASNAVTYQGPANLHATWQNSAIAGNGDVSGKIAFTTIYDNDTITKARDNSNWDFAGINLAGLEFGKAIDPSVIPNLSVEDIDASSSDLNDTQQFIQDGANTVRVPVSWSYLQNEGAGKGPINTADYYDVYVRPLLRSLTKAKVNTIVDLHTYMRYPKFGEQYSGCSGYGPCPDGTLITDENAYIDIWSKLYTLIKNDPEIDQNYIMLDLVNEPVNVPDDKVFTIQAAVIKSLRNQGFNGYILVEGNSWTGLHSWTTSQWSSSDGKTYTNATLFTRENFINAGITDLSKIIINVHQYLDSNFSGTGDDCQQDIWTTGDNGFNLNAFTEYLQQNQLKAIVTEFGAGQNASNCTAPMQQFAQYLKDNSAKGKDYGFVGWTIWATGHGWGGYNLRVKPDSYQWSVLKQFLE